MNNYLQQIMTYFRNLALNSAGVERNLYQLIQDGDIEAAIDMMQNRDDEVNSAIKEYNPQTHEVMSRSNKYRKNDDPYISEKLPRTRQRYINEVELFFLLGNPIKWKKENGSDDAFALFTDFIKTTRFNSTMRQSKRLAGAETESAKIYHLYRDDRTGERQVRSMVLARSNGYKLRPLFDQYGNMTAFAYGYKLKENGKTVQHWDIQTPDMLFFCRKGNIGYEVESYPNPTGKINVLYYSQPKAWDGAEPRLKREEILDSKVGDTNNYFADPIAVASAILFDTFTPDFSFDKIKGMGTLSGDAIKNAMILGYIKRDNRKEMYEELIDREKNLIISILKYLHLDKTAGLDKLEISFEFSEPFTEDKQRTWNAIGKLYTDGIASLEQVVQMLALTDAPEEEVERIRSEKGNEKGDILKNDLILNA